MHNDLQSDNHSQNPISDEVIREAWLANSGAYSRRLGAEFRHRMESEEKGVQLNRTTVRERQTGYNRFAWLRNSAILAAFMSVAWIGSQYYAGSVMAQQTSVYTTPNGERATVNLPDGSSVVLNVGSRLEVPGNFGFRERSIRLTGEALFIVREHTRAPFVVSAGAATTKVLGTRFIVRHYPGDTTTVVAVKEGRVSVQSMVANANEQIRVSPDGLTSLRASTPGQFTFASGILTLEGQTLIAAIPELNRWYDADIRVAGGEMNDLRVFGEFSAGSLSDLVEVFEMTFNMRVERNGRVITLFQR